MNINDPKNDFYLLPNLFTTAGLFAGFYAVVAALKGNFETAAIWIFIAMILDGLDGRIARLTNTTSAFGAEYDSLADMVSFGIAPALVVYSWSLVHLGKPGWVAAFIFTASVALRLARFNTQISKDTDKRFFYGLPCPAAAGVLASLVWVTYQFEITLSPVLNILVAVITMMVGLLMVSEIRYFSFKQFDLQGKVPFIVLLVIMLVITAIAVAPPTLLFLSFVGYALSGIVFMVMQWFRGRRR
jgi:CDP-diacylglycerol--serine O-phosphatidyltransferase